MNWSFCLDDNGACTMYTVNCPHHVQWEMQYLYTSTVWFVCPLANKVVGSSVSTGFTATERKLSENSSSTASKRKKNLPGKRMPRHQRGSSSRTNNSALSLSMWLCSRTERVCDGEDHDDVDDEHEDEHQRDPPVLPPKGGVTTVDATPTQRNAQ